ncbi:MAG: hypothetical protein HQL26_11175, partial [Candidatus Omnitrophica bacterium]|nr:hypothetical protein [Candidatus Omnitrophota bacterium]
VAITNDVSSNETMNLVWSSGISGNQALKVSSTGFIYNPSIGNIGIGTSAITTARLHVRGAGTTTGQAFAVQDSTLSDNFVVLDNGNVGIGTSNPTTQLTLNAPSGFVGDLFNFQINGASYFKFNTAAGFNNTMTWNQVGHFNITDSTNVVLMPTNFAYT